MDNMAATATVDDLQMAFLDSLEEVWENGSSASYGVGTHAYVQWAKWPEGLQIECISNEFLPSDRRLTFTQRRRLSEIGLNPPSAESPNYYRRFFARRELPEAATVLARVVVEVLGYREGEIADVSAEVAVTSPPSRPAFAEVARPFAEAFVAKRSLLQADLSPRQLARVKESLSDDLKKLCDVAVPDLKPPMVSRAARARAKKMGIDLCRQAWHDQPRFDAGREAFHLEHVTPILTLRVECLAASSVDDVVELLDRRIRLAWVLKDEDRQLTKLGFRHQRPDPDAAYRQAGIELVVCHH